MVTKKIYTVQDIKGDTYLPPIYYQNQVQASRAFETAVKDENSQFYKFPEDFVLLEIGEWDEDKGKLSPYSDHKIICTASEFIGGVQ